MENNNKENMCSCHSCGEQKNSCGGCGSCCRSINHHSVIRILVGVIVLMVVLFAGFKMGLFFSQAVNGTCGLSSYRSGWMMNRAFDGSGSGYDYNYGPGMMGNYYYKNSQGTASQDPDPLPPSPQQ